MIKRPHAKYYPELFVKKSVGDDIDTLSLSLVSVSVDVVPNQIEAALSHLSIRMLYVPAISGLVRQSRQDWCCISIGLWIRVRILSYAHRLHASRGA